MRRRDFVLTTASAAISSQLLSTVARADDKPAADGACCQIHESPAAAMKSPREELAYVTTTCVGIDAERPDHLATVNVNPASPTYSQIIHRLPMSAPGDELHHFGWNACGSCFGDKSKSRSHLILPGLRSSRIHVADLADPRAPKMHKVITFEDVVGAVDLVAPHTVHCLPDGKIMLSMLGGPNGGGDAGFLILDDQFRVHDAWTNAFDKIRYNYDFWYQPRHNVMVSSEWAYPQTFMPGFKLEDVKAGKYGSRLNFWDWQKKDLSQTIELGETGLIPLEVRFHHDPASTHGFVGAALSSTMWHFHKTAEKWQADKVIAVDPVETAGWPFPVPGLITDLVLSLDDRWLYFSNWLHGDIRQYDVSDPAHPKLTAQAWLGGVIGKGEKFGGRKLPGGPQMLQLSLDGKRLYVTNSLFSSWDDQFYPDIAKAGGSYLMQLDCNTDAGGLTVNEKFFVDFGNDKAGPSRAHEIRFPGGDSTSDIWV